MTQQPAETKDRLSEQQLSELVAGPSLVRDKGLPDGGAAFDKLLEQTKSRYGDNSIQVADLLTAFGVQLYLEGANSEKRALKEAALPYLRSAVPVYQRAFGAEHPEVALALTTYADAITGLDKDAAPEEAERLLREAARIRIKALGPSNIETRGTLVQLAELSARPQRVRGDRQRMNKAAATLEKLIREAPNDPAQKDTSAPRIRFVLAEAYAKNGFGKEAVEEADQAVTMMGGWPAQERCLTSGAQLMKLANVLRDHHESEFADKLSERRDLSKLIACAS